MRSRFFACLVLVFVSLLAVGQDQVRRSNLTVTLEGRRYAVHTVARGETLYSIAKAYGADEADIVERNPFVERGLRVGQTLLVLSAGSPSAPQVRPIDPPKVTPPLKVIHSQTPDAVQRIPDSGMPNSGVEPGLIRDIEPGSPINVAMLLPFGLGRTDVTFVDFYRGSLLALSALKELGVSVDVDVLSTSGSTQGVEQLIHQGMLESANLIIGPVYDEPFELVARYATERAVPIISPLGGTGSANSPYVIAVAPNESTKWDKFKDMLCDPSSNVILIDHQHFADTAVMRQMREILPHGVKRLSYVGKATPVNELSDLLDRERQNIVVVAISNENAVEQVLARLSSINTLGRYKISVVGTSKWSRFSAMDMELLFKLSATYPASYFMDRSDSRVAQFYSDYITAFGSVPTLFSFRGYDVMKSFVELLSRHGARSLLELEGYAAEVLQTPYSYTRHSPREKFFNAAWAVVNYNPNYTISIH